MRNERNKRTNNEGTATKRGETNESIQGSKRTRVSGEQNGFHEQRRKENELEDKRRKAVETTRKKNKDIRKKESESLETNKLKKSMEGKLGLNELAKQDEKIQGGDKSKSGLVKAIGFNPFSYRSVKENLVDDGVNRTTKSVLNRFSFGLGNAIEKVNQKFTGKDKMDYTGKMTPMGKIVLALVAVLIVIIAWFLLAMTFMILAFGAVALLMDDDDGSSSGGKEKTEQTDGGLTSGKGKPMPPELQGKFLLPNTERVTSMVGQRNNPTGNPPVRRMHWGADMAHRKPAFSSLRLYPVAPGKVIKVTDLYKNGSGKGLGNMVIIDHGNGYTSLYGHLTPGIPVKVGDMVGIDTTIGIMGHTGNSTGFHLHLEMYEGGAENAQNTKHWVDSFKMLSCTDKKPMPYGAGLKTECYEYQKKARGIE